MTGQQLKNSILQMAVQGKLVPQDPNDEPASVLLERIRAEKEQLIKEGKIKREKNPSRIFRGADNLPYEQVGKNEPVCIADEVPFEIPDSWEWVRLSAVNEMFTGNSINETEKKQKYTNTKDGYNYIATKDVGFDQAIDYNNGIKIPFGLDKFKVAPTNSILLCVEGGSAGRKIAFTNQDVCFGNKLCCFISYGINYQFLYYYIQSPLFQSAFKSNKTGIIGGVSVNVLKEMFMPVPPPNEQLRIIEQIKTLEPYLNSYTKSEEELSNLNITFPEVFKKSILQQAVQGKLVPQDENDEPASVLLERIRVEKQRLISEGKIKKDKNESVIFRRDNSHYEKLNGIERCIDDEVPFEIPADWEWCRLGSVVEKLTDGTHKTPKYQSSGIPFLSVKDISSGKISFDTCKYISLDEHKELYCRCDSQFGDMLLTKVGTTGIPVLVDSKIEFSLFVSVALIKFNHRYLYDKYFLYLLQSPLVQKQCIKNTKGVGNKNWVMRDIANTLLAIPPLAEQQRIVEKIEQLLAITDKL